MRLGCLSRVLPTAMRAFPVLLACFIGAFILACLTAVQSDSALAVPKPHVAIAQKLAKRQDSAAAQFVAQRPDLQAPVIQQDHADGEGARIDVRIQRQPQSLTVKKLNGQIAGENGQTAVSGQKAGSNRQEAAPRDRSIALPQHPGGVQMSKEVRKRPVAPVPVVDQPVVEQSLLVDMQQEEEALAKAAEPKGADNPAVQHHSSKHVAEGPAPTESTLPFKRETLRRLPVRRGTFLYLVMGKHNPAGRWQLMSHAENVTLFFLSWHKKSDFKADACARYKYFYLPHSTWTSGRNELLRQGYMQEKAQGWRFEFFMFFDEDVQLSYFVSSHQKRGVPNNELSFRLLQNLLLRDRPGRASVKIGGIPLAPLEFRKPKCARACYTDAAVDIYHRTLLDYVMPYLNDFDQLSWYMSAYVNNLRLSILAPKFCSIYRQLEIDTSVQEHGKYPRGKGGMDRGKEWTLTRDFVFDRLASVGYPGLIPASSADMKYRRFEWGLFGELRHTKEEKCTRVAPDIDFGELLRERLKFWPTEWKK